MFLGFVKMSFLNIEQDYSICLAFVSGYNDKVDYHHQAYSVEQVEIIVEIFGALNITITHGHREWGYWTSFLSVSLHFPVGVRWERAKLSKWVTKVEGRWLLGTLVVMNDNYLLGYKRQGCKEFYCSPCTNTCIYLLSFTSLLLAITYVSFQFLFSTNHHHLLHINIRLVTRALHIYVHMYIFLFIISWTLIKLICISRPTNGGHLSGLVHVINLNLRQPALRENPSPSGKSSPITIPELSFRGLSLREKIGPTGQASPVFVLPLLMLYNTHSYSPHQWVAFPQIKDIKLITKLFSFCHLTTQMRWLLFHLLFPNRNDEKTKAR